MPVYDYKCPNCGRKESDRFVHKFDAVVECIQCKAVMKKLFTNSAKFVQADVFPSDGVFLEHVSATGKRFFSKKEMRDYEIKNDVELGYLL